MNKEERVALRANISCSCEMEKIDISRELAHMLTLHLTEDQMNILSSGISPLFPVETIICLGGNIYGKGMLIVLQSTWGENSQRFLLDGFGTRVHCCEDNPQDCEYYFAKEEGKTDTTKICALSVDTIHISSRFVRIPAKLSGSIKECHNSHYMTFDGRMFSLLNIVVKDADGKYEPVLINEEFCLPSGTPIKKFVTFRQSGTNFSQYVLDISGFLWLRKFDGSVIKFDILGGVIVDIFRDICWYMHCFILTKTGEIIRTSVDEESGSSDFFTTVSFIKDEDEDKYEEERFPEGISLYDSKRIGFLIQIQNGGRNSLFYGITDRGFLIEMTFYSRDKNPPTIRIPFANNGLKRFISYGTHFLAQDKDLDWFQYNDLEDRSIIPILSGALPIYGHDIVQTFGNTTILWVLKDQNSVHSEKMSVYLSNNRDSTFQLVPVPELTYNPLFLTSLPKSSNSCISL